MLTIMINVQVHKVILAGASDYFMSLFSSNEKPNLQSKSYFNYSILSMNSIIEYLYSGVIHLSEYNIEQITDISEFLQVLNCIYILLNILITKLINVYLYRRPSIVVITIYEFTL